MYIEQQNHVTYGLHAQSRPSYTYSLGSYPTAEALMSKLLVTFLLMPRLVRMLSW